MDYYSPEIQKTLKALTEQTKRGLISWEIMEYDPIGFMSEMGVEFEGSETENFALNIAFRCRSRKGRIIWFETYESIGFPSSKGFPAPGDGFSLRGLGYYTLRFLSSDGQVLYQMGSIIRKRSQYLLLCLLADAVFVHMQPVFSQMPEKDPSAFLRYLHHCDESGGLESHPFSVLMSEFYRQNRCRDFHLLAMSCANGIKKGREK